jgi:cell division protein FtsB
MNTTERMQAENEALRQENEQYARDWKAMKAELAKAKLNYVNLKQMLKAENPDYTLVTYPIKEKDNDK